MTFFYKNATIPLSGDEWGDMAAGLFTLYFLIVVLVLKRLHTPALIFSFAALVLCLALFMHHITAPIPIRL